MTDSLLGNLNPDQIAAWIRACREAVSAVRSCLAAVIADTSHPETGKKELSAPLKNFLGRQVEQLDSMIAYLSDVESKQAYSEFDRDEGRKVLKARLRGKLEELSPIKEHIPEYDNYLAFFG